MLKVRVIPCLDIKDGRVVKGVNFVGLRDAGDPVEQAIVYDAAGAMPRRLFRVFAVSYSNHFAGETLTNAHQAHRNDFPVVT